MIPLTTETCNALLHGLSTMGMFDAAFMIFDWMEGYGNLSNSITYNEIIRICCLIGNLKMGIVLFSKMTNACPLPTVTSYSTLMYGFIEQMDLYNAVRLMSLLKADGLEPDDVAYGILIMGFCRAGELDGARANFIKMVDRKVMPNGYHYTSLIDAYFKQERVEEVLGLLKDYGCTPQAYDAIIFCYLERNLLSEAVEVFKMMREFHHEVNYKQLVDGLCQYGDMSHVKIMICDLWKRGNVSRLPTGL